MTNDDVRFKDQEKVDLVAGEPVVDKTVISATDLTPVKEVSYFEPKQLIGTVLDEKYRLDSFIGRGGMGTVYRATHLALNRTVAIKVLHKHLINHQAIADRFRLEAQAAHALRHQNLASVSDFGFSKDGQFYIVMDFIDGQTLDARLKDGPLTYDEFQTIFHQVLAGLRHCHKSGIVHRDIKPSNIILSGTTLERDSVKLVDFGIAKVLPGNENSIEQLTQTGELLGSPLYMSPEQCRGESVDERTDLYSLGCVMFEALAGNPPFKGTSAIDTLMMHCSEPPPIVPGLESKTPAANQINAFLKKAMSKNREDRFAGAKEMDDALAVIDRFLRLPRAAREKLDTATLSTDDLARKRNKTALLLVMSLMIIVGCGSTLTLCTNLFHEVSKEVNGIASEVKNEIKKEAGKAGDAEAVGPEELIRLGRTYRKDNEIKKSKITLTKAAALAKARMGETNILYVEALDELAQTETEIGQNNDDPSDSNDLVAAQGHLLKVIELAEQLAKQYPDELAPKDLQAKGNFHLAHLETILASRQQGGGSGFLKQADEHFKRGFALIGSDAPAKDATYHEFYRYYADYLWDAGREWEAAKIELRLDNKDWAVDNLGDSQPATPVKCGGKWEDRNQDFSLKLKQTGENISGEHLVIFQNGDKTDDGELSASISKGIISGKTESSWGGNIEFKIVPINGFLVWRITGGDDGEAYLPLSAVLQPQD